MGIWKIETPFYVVADSETEAVAKAGGFFDRVADGTYEIETPITGWNVEEIAFDGAEPPENAYELCMQVDHAFYVRKCGPDYVTKGIGEPGGPVIPPFTQIYRDENGQHYVYERK